MKRLIASRRLKRTCIHCERSFKKGDVYYKTRNVAVESLGLGEFDIWATEYLTCPRCKYYQGRSLERFKEFREKCDCPDVFIDTRWDYIPGECVKEPLYDYCRICGKICEWE